MPSLFFSSSPFLTHHRPTIPQTIPRSPSVQALNVTALRVRLVHVKDLIHYSTGKPVQSMINVKFELIKQDGFPHTSKKFKSAAHCDASNGDMEGDGVVEFDQVFLLDDLYTMSAELHVRVFESSIIKDQLLGEMTLPLREDLALSSTPTYICGTEKEDVATFILYDRPSSQSQSTKRVGLVQLGLLLQ